MLNIGTGELFVVLLVGLIVLGPQKLPEVARQVGRVAGELRRMANGFNDELRSAMRELDEEATSPQAPPPLATPPAAAPGAPADDPLGAPADDPLGPSPEA